MTAGIWAVVPVKDFQKAKSRLAPELDEAGRAVLARRLFSHVLGVLQQSRELSGILVVTDSEAIEALATAHGAHVMRDSGVLELGRILDGALETLSFARAALVVMADLPELAARDVCELLDLGRRFDTVIAPDRHERRTNALYQTRPFSRTRFGEENSFARHLADAEARGSRVAVHRSLGLALDLDEPRDLLFWQSVQEPVRASARAGAAE